MELSGGGREGVVGFFGGEGGHRGLEIDTYQPVVASCEIRKRGRRTEKEKNKDGGRVEDMEEGLTSRASAQSISLERVCDASRPAPIDDCTVESTSDLLTPSGMA